MICKLSVVVVVFVGKEENWNLTRKKKFYENPQHIHSHFKSNWKSNQYDSMILYIYNY